MAPETETDLRYDTASMRSYGANVREFWLELQRQDPVGMSADQALECTLELIKTIALTPRTEE